ncbi:MAG: peptidoglycan DD-metalloendopeptidase family protein [Devosiaceae bacterium]|nr:peptidoglycan DD-metalloendopeptidase family protein [Devosiaceae bacterium]
MSSRVNTRAVKSASALAFVVLGSILLAGCSTLGGFPTSQLNSDNLVTGSIRPVEQGDLAQPMPGVLQPVQSSNASRGPYLPPANVGGNAMINQGVAPLTTASIPTATLLPPIQNSATIVPSQALPPAIQSSSVGSQQTMSAQTQSSIAPPRVTQPFQDNSVPQVTASRTAPALAVVSSGAQTTPPMAGTNYVHTVESGESLYAIARRYDVASSAIVQANSLAAADQIFVGQKLIIPGRADLVSANTGGNVQAQADPITTASVPVPQSQTGANSAPPAPAVSVPAPSASPPQQVASTAPPVSAAQGFRWPVTGKVIVNFLESNRTGINIEAPSGAAVRAVENGTVIYVGSGVSGFGNLVLVRHSNGYVSAYAHLKEITVAKGNNINRGDPVGTIGMSGSVTRPQLHFELRQGATPVDPMPLLAS